MLELVASDGKTWKVGAAELDALLANHRELVEDGKLKLDYPSAIVEHVVEWISTFGKGSISSQDAQKNKELRQQFFLLLSKEELLSTLEIAERIGLNSLLDGGAQYVSDLLSNMTDAEMKAYLDVERDPLSADAEEKVHELLKYVTEE
ncbi:Skp1 family, dimerization domain-containing protein [Giardia duodenalis]|uniref:Skp1 family, dimerization domain-containing protein n=1 Tax=Giardia intestinalis (strain ATCC 50803 / WB clone C6) TaxID=184922 RepID=A8B5N5_GIAIC|nr:Skp1 family, dimerization domain-containing protein [Giardia intestinalis]KAE8305141.1 Skp1 family, dimerization domain-containing protein [Giardia intestinalis]|eukprot:XP_001709267.1 Hypothetical protein GL50803_2509 [Giardia lamblia ATCC 50803]